MTSQTPLQMKRSSSSMQVAAKKSQLVEFPTSPQPSVVGEEITHYTHPKHPLIEITLHELFQCSGCKEYGAGKRFACQQCGFQLHHFCASSPPLLKNHPFHGQHQLVFHATKPAKSGMSWPRCDVCGKSTKGFTFRCRACNFQMHPCCAMLSTEIHFPTVHPHPLRLLQTFNTQENVSSCGECKKKGPGRMYSCTVCEYHLHAVCAKGFINGLQHNGVSPPEKSSVVGTAARFASQIVVEFIGALIEGFGEGMGEVIVQSITRGRCLSRRSRTLE
ncbi:hypothetical protein BUALT_Bualt08G0001700 [Buddleja alternifolia]|uniref:DC1 domain-containing protein n=1 Tax=Buddleja alternifolia TaxID=168488 RepID=A0AAV6X467_9LAMI|nr:hypothetical protein BUALT_Bualt08G0001700 [Buddleja alternifolia]